MFGGDGHAWNSLVERLRARPEYVEQFKAVFGTLPTRDGVAKAIATYERTVLSGNSIHDRADLVMHARVDADESGKFEFKASDYETALKAAFAAKDVAALEALELTADDAAKAPAVAESLLRGRNLYFGKARCNSCHVGDNFTDNAFHNLGVGVRDGKLPENALGRFGSQPIGQKDPALVGAFKTPTLRHLLGTAPYLHDGSEDTLAKVVDFYDRGGNANEFLDPKMRSAEAEAAYAQSVADGTEYKGPPVKLFGAAKTPIVPLALNLTPAEKKDLVLFLRALQGDPADPIVADKTKLTLK
jgi:cytochrome c peroxidase